VRRLLRGLLILALAFSAMPGRAMTALFYQPLLADRSLPAERWPALFAAVRARGFDTLVVQWAEYGDAFTAPADRAWLLARLQDARAAGLVLVLGLAADPAFFQRQAAEPAARAAYLQSLERADVSAAGRWIDGLGSEAIAGWYLPLEIDDLHWRDPAVRQLLTAHLRNESAKLAALEPTRPIYVTAFFSGRMAPAAYRQMLADMTASGLRVWVQDGAGVASALSPQARALYLQAASGCADAAAQGRVHEIFQEVASGGAFRARPLPPDALADALAQRTPCGGDSAFFELRYLPEGAALLH